MPKYEFFEKDIHKAMEQLEDEGFKMIDENTHTEYDQSFLLEKEGNLVVIYSTARKVFVDF